jgi:TolA-binding protein
VARITRKELKTDKFALEVEHTVTFFEQHKKEMTRYGAIAAAAVLLLVGYSLYARRQHTLREDALAKAIQVQEAPAAAASMNGGLTFPTQEAKDQAAIKAFTDLMTSYPGSEEAEIAEYYLGSIEADQGKLDGAEKRLLNVADKADARYASLAKFSLAQIYYSTHRLDQAEKTLRDLIAHPTVYVSSDQATITLVRYISRKNPAEARKLLEPLRSRPGAIGQVAVGLYGELFPQ